MKNDQLLPFERNRYYAGKLLTSADFEAEQSYMNNKRRFLNHTLFGSGIICGLNVVMLDDLSLLVESGAAIDGAGREIVVEEAVIRKLSAIEGSDALGGDRALLCIRYQEEAVHDVYCGDMGNGRDRYECNRIDEGYELYLEDGEEDGEGQEDACLLSEKLVDTPDYTVTVSIPHTVPKGHDVKLTVTVRKDSEAAKALSLHARVQLPVLTAQQGAHELEIDIRDLMLLKGQQSRRDYWLNVEHAKAEETTLICRREDMAIRIGEEQIQPGKGLQMKLALSDQAPYDLAAGMAGSAGLGAKERAAKDGGVPLARIQLIRTGVSCLIGRIEERGVKQYIAAPGKMDQRQMLLSSFASRGRMEQEDAARDSREQKAAIAAASTAQPLMASGRLEIPLGVNMKKGDVCVSEEIMHGLGKGNVYVDVGMEYLNGAAMEKNSRRNTVYGDPALFGLDECMQVETAVRVLNDKGSFQVAAKLLGEQKSIVLQLDWVAFKFNTIKELDEMQEEDRSIVPDTPTVRLKAKDSYHFNVSFHGLQPCRLSYELTEPGSGEISADGIYTAPAKEGVYEIHIYCTDLPRISTYVYAIVSR